MTATLETLVIAGYVFACELQTPRPVGRPPEVSDEELVALAVAQATTGICSDRQLLGMVGQKALSGLVTDTPNRKCTSNDQPWTVSVSSFLFAVHDGTLRPVSS